MAVVTVQFKVGENRTDAIVRLFSKVLANQDWLPANLGVGAPIVKPKGIDDVPDHHRHPVVQGPGQGGLRAGPGGPRHRAGDQARPGHQGRLHRRRPTPGGAGAARSPGPGGHGIDLTDLRRSLQAGQPDSGQPDRHRRQPGDPGPGRHLPEHPGGDRRPGGRAARRAARVPAGRGDHRARPGATPQLRPGWGPARAPTTSASSCPDHPGGDRRGGQAGGGQRRAGGRAGHRAPRPAPGDLHPRGRRGHGDAQLRRYRRRQGQEAHQQADLRHGLGDPAGDLRHRLAGVHHRRRGGRS